MPEKLDYRDLRRTEADNYSRDFVPLIPAPLALDLIEVAAPTSGEFVVDVACGTGVVTRLAAERVGPDGKVIGVDLSPEMLEVAACNPSTHGAPIEWREADAQALPLPDASYDLVLCQLGLMFVPDPSAAIHEMRRILSPGGRLVINTPASMPRLFAIMSEALGRHISPDLSGFLRAVFSLHKNDLRTLLDAARFQDVTVKITTKTLPLPSPVEFLWQYVKVTPIAAVVLGANEDRRREFENDVIGQWQNYVDDGGLTLELSIATATARK
ncbi:class I SAM-dependent methyltransferase [Mycolicibacterium celeriflavum]|uniref:class I SAM-dependent methyltransferase n=1 Tax=Mycolicibacterium celeriflavum TaxID=1249101 RepID=UPI003CF952DA